MRVIEKTARTVDEAIADALAELGARRDEVDIEILEEGNKGLFGLLGAKQARVRVSLKAQAESEAGQSAGQAAAWTGLREAAKDASVLDEEEAVEEDDFEGGEAFGDGEELQEEAAPAGPPDEARIARAREFLAGVLERMELDAALETRIDDDGTVHVNIVGQDLGLIIGRRGQTLDALQFLVNQVANRGEGRRIRVVLDAEGYRARRAEALTALARRMAAKARRLRRKVALEPMNALERRIVHLALADDAHVETYSEGEEPHRRVIIAPRDV